VAESIKTRTMPCGLALLFIMGCPSDFPSVKCEQEQRLPDRDDVRMNSNHD
jgi:hypothetical protein